MDVSNQHFFQHLFRAYEPQLAATPMSLDQRKAVDSILYCRHGELGQSVYECPHGHRHEQAHSCRHRSCYLCAQRARHQWVEAQKQRLLNCPHFHLVFTLPSEYRVLWQYNTAWFVRTLFQCAQQTVLKLMADRRHHGVTPGVMFTLHTWGRQLNLHPHVHGLVTAGGLTPTGEWQETGDYLLPIHVVKSLYRGLMQTAIGAALKAGSLRLPPDLTLAAALRQHRALYKKAWSVRIEEQYRHGKGVVLYLSRYMKGGPLNPAQIQHVGADGIAFRFRDHRDQRLKSRLLSPIALIRQLLRHVPPCGVHTVRHYGLYASACRDKRNLCRRQLGDLRHIETGGGCDRDEMLFWCCRACGGPLKLRYQRFGIKPRKGISINRAGRGVSVQQDDESVIANPLRIRGPCHACG